MALGRLMITLGLMLLFSERRAEAFYLDPTTGSIAYQVAIGGLLAASAAARLYWGRIQGVVRMVLRRGRTGDSKP